MTSPDSATRRAAAEAAPRHVFATFIRATPEAIWRALTESDFTTRYWYGSTVPLGLDRRRPVGAAHGAGPASGSRARSSRPTRRTVS